MSCKMTFDIFKNRAKLLHNERYDYSKFNYINSITQGIIICKKHGEFLQTTNSHLSGKGCSKCAGKYKSTQDFIIESNNLHNSKYNYSKFIYTKASDKGIIICPIHGKFLQSPHKHLSGHGCQKCGKTAPSNTVEFISKSLHKHHNKYDYSKVDYKKWNTPVIIICRKHGEFRQTPNNHLSGSGCLSCNYSKGEAKIQHWLKDNNIIYAAQKRFADCKNKRNLVFDFYLPNENILIEFDGEQHFNVNGWIHKHKFSSIEYEKVKTNDNIKNEYAKLKNIKMVRIPYYEFESISNILDELIYHNQ